MFDLKDIKKIQLGRPDLNDDQASEVLGFLNDVYAVQSYDIPDNNKLFMVAADLIYPEVQNEH